MSKQLQNLVESAMPVPPTPPELYAGLEMYGKRRAAPAPEAALFGEDPHAVDPEQQKKGTVMVRNAVLTTLTDFRTVMDRGAVVWKDWSLDDFLVALGKFTLVGEALSTEPRDP